ncbi:MAG: PKD domain-containing protein [Bacteroidia bacterium]
MHVQLSVPNKFRERSGVDSQVLARDGFPQIGVMFTTSESPSEKDFDTSKLIGTLLEDTEKRGVSENRFHRVIGGYFFTPKAGPSPKVPGQGTTTQVFGIALEGHIGIKEGGTTVISDNWRDLAGTLRFLNENRPLFDDPTGQPGWTFITEPLFGDNAYPRSRDPLLFVRECPTIDSIDTIYHTPTATEQKVTFIVNRSQGHIERLKWDFGDGTTDESKENEISHTYTRLEGETVSFTVKVELEGVDGCKDNAETEVEIPGLECPTIDGLVLDADEPSATSLKVNAEIQISGKPDKISIDWGDGSAPEDVSGTSASHVYTRSIGDDKTFSVSVKISGPASCAAQANASVTVPGRCPEISELTVTDIANEDYTQTVKVIATMVDGLEADAYFWDFGDGSKIIRTLEPSATHVYKKDKQVQQYSISVKTSGPDSCSTSAETSVTIDKGLSCPIIQKLHFKADPAKNGKVKIHAEVQWDEGTPTQIDIDWGDGTVDKNINSTNATHEYPQPVGVYAVYDVVVTLSGPGDCLSSLKEKVKVPASSCGKIKSVNVTVNNTSVSEQSVSATLDLDGSFESYTFDWGDGTVDPASNASTATHVYSRGTQDHTHTIKVSATGPGPCDDEATTKHSVPAKEKIVPPPPPPTPEKSALCIYMPYVVAFLSALSLGHLAMLITALNTASTDTGLAWGASIASVVLLIIAIIVWYRSCKPTRCDWLAVGWVTFLGASIPIFNSLDCAAQDPLIPTLISFVIGGVFGFLWFRSCSPKSKSKVFLIYFGLLILAGIIAGILTTPAVMNC